MKKLFLSTGLAAIGIAGVQSVCAEDMGILTPKAWSLGGTLRGFYDDNYAIANSKKGSWGGEVSPNISVNLPLRQTDFGLRYYYTLYYYNDRDDLGVNPFDHSHQVELWLDHALNERWKLRVTDHFAVGQEPDLLQPNPAGGNPVNYRINGDNFANQLDASLDTQWTRHFSTTLDYHNSWYVYDNHGANVIPGGSLDSFQLLPPSTPGQTGFRQFSNGPTLAGRLDRMEHNASLDLNWTFSPETKIFGGYSFSQVNYLGNEPIAILNFIDKTPQVRSLVYRSSNRDSRSHNFHVGFNHQLTANITAALSAGVSYSDSYNDPIQHSTSISPSANGSISYTYIPGSYVQLGVSQSENSTDVVEPDKYGSITQYQHSTVVYGDWNHRFTEKLSGTLIGRFVYSSFEGGQNNNVEEFLYSAGINFGYQFSRHFSADVGYNYDLEVTPLFARSFSRNRVYLGLSANY
jgi:hypothetical protein